MSRWAPVIVMQTPEVQASVWKLLCDEKLSLLIDDLTCNPAVGDLIPGTGGVRKLRWGLEGRGKRGGTRVIYFCHDTDVPLFALTAHAKSERSDLSQADRNEFRVLTGLLVEAYRKRRRK